MEAYVGNLLQIQCSNDFKPEPERSWMKVGDEMPDSRRIQFQYSKSVMMISRARLADSGEYQCTAKNDAGQSSITVTAIVYGKYFIPFILFHFFYSSERLFFIICKHQYWSSQYNQLHCFSDFNFQFVVLI